MVQRTFHALDMEEPNLSSILERRERKDEEIHHPMNNSLRTSFKTLVQSWWLASEALLPNDSQPHYSMQFPTTSLQLLPVCQDISAFKCSPLPGVSFHCFLDLTTVPWFGLSHHPFPWEAFGTF